MWAWEEWEQAATKMGRNLEATDKRIETLAALHAWGAGKQAKEQLRRKKFETYLEELLCGTGRTLGQAVTHACTPARTLARTPAASTWSVRTSSTTTPRRPVWSPGSPGSLRSVTSPTKKMKAIIYNKICKFDFQTRGNLDVLHSDCSPADLVPWLVKWRT